MFTMFFPFFEASKYARVGMWSSSKLVMVFELHSTKDSLHNGKSFFCLFFGSEAFINWWIKPNKMLFQSSLMKGTCFALLLGRNSDLFFGWWSKV
jgi:hypothetical protein